MSMSLFSTLNPCFYLGNVGNFLDFPINPTRTPTVNAKITTSSFSPQSNVFWLFTSTRFILLVRLIRIADAIEIKSADSTCFTTAPKWFLLLRGTAWACQPARAQKLGHSGNFLSPHRLMISTYFTLPFIPEASTPKSFHRFDPKNLARTKHSTVIIFFINSLPRLAFWTLRPRSLITTGVQKATLPRFSLSTLRLWS